MSAYLLAPLVQIGCCLALSVLVLRAGLRELSRRLFFFYLLGLALWAFVIYGMRSSPDTQRALVWERSLPPVGFFITVILFHFTLVFTARRRPRILLWALYLLCLALIPIGRTGLLYRDMQVKFYGYAPLAGPLLWPYLMASYAFGVIVLVRLVQYSRTRANADERNRALYIIVGIVITFIGGLFDILPMLGLPLYPGFIISNILFCCTTTVAIVKHNLLDIRVIVRRAVGYLITIVLFATVYAVIDFLVFPLVGGPDKTVLTIWFHLGLIVILVFAASRLLPSLQKYVDRAFYRGRYHYLRALNRSGHDAQSLTRSQEFVPQIVDLLAGALRAHSVHLYQSSTLAAELEFAYSPQPEEAGRNLKIATDGLFGRHLASSTTILTSTDLDVTPKLQGVIARERHLLNEMQAALIVPLRTRPGQLLGLLVMGPKNNAQPYNVEDTQLVQAVGNDLAVNLENARLYGDAVKARKNLEAWLNNMADSVIIVGSDDRIQFMNRPATDAFGERLGQNCWSPLGQEAQQRVKAMLAASHTTTDPGDYSIGIRGRHYDLAAGRLTSPEGSPSVILTLRDVTHRLRMEQELAKTQRLESLGVLAGGIAHDFNNLLAGILGNISFATSYGKLDDMINECLAEAKEATLRGKDLTQQLLTFSRGGEPVIKNVRMGKLLRDVVNFSLRGRSAVCEFSIPDDLWSAEADEGQIGQVVSNLTLNAAQANPKGGVITVEAENVGLHASDKIPLREGRYVKVAIRDTGKGIPTAHLSRVFDPFFTTQETGSGLGLAVVHSILRNHKGRVEVTSEVDVGTTVWFYLPASEAEPLESSPQTREVHSGQGRILLMDDEPAVRTVCARILQGIGYTVELAHDGDQALKLYSKSRDAGQPFDAVILDLTVVGGKGGEDTVRELEQIDPEVKAIASSGYSTSPVMAEHERYGFAAVVTKPYTMDELAAVVQQVISASSA